MKVGVRIFASCNVISACVKIVCAHLQNCCALFSKGRIKFVRNKMEGVFTTEANVHGTKSYNIEPQKMRLVKNEVTSLESLSKEQLIEQVNKLERHVQQLRNIIAKQNNGEEESKSKNKKHRELDFRRYKKKHVALKLLYLGWDYHGLAVQEDIVKTIEGYLFAALQKTKLVQSRETCNYSRCGRTDKGVSALSQVVSLDLRTNLLEGDGVITPEDYIPQEEPAKEKKEIQYCVILNRILPPEIRVIAVASAASDFNARYDCILRTYKYLFPKGDLNIQEMKSAGQLLVGVHDFRNFCKMGVSNGVVDYIREICNVDVVELSSSSDGQYQMCELTIIGKSFLWHQVRYIASALFLVGQGKESSEVISQLLDIENCPKKPQYAMAYDYPLLLFDCQYENLTWEYDQEALDSLIYHLEKLWTQHEVKATIIKTVLDGLKMTIPPVNIRTHSKSVTVEGRSRVYTPLMKRPVCESLEERIENLVKKGKMTILTEDTQGSSY